MAKYEGSIKADFDELLSAIESGVVKVRNKGKSRIVLIPKILQKKLRIYIKKKGDTKRDDLLHEKRKGKGSV